MSSERPSIQQWRKANMTFYREYRKYTRTYSYTNKFPQPGGTLSLSANNRIVQIGTNVWAYRRLYEYKRKIKSQIVSEYLDHRRLRSALIKRGTLRQSRNREDYICVLYRHPIAQPNRYINEEYRNKIPVHEYKP